METNRRKKKKSGHRPENVRIAKTALGILGSTQASASSSTRPQPPQPHLPSLLSFLSLLLQLSKLFTLHLLSEGHQEAMAAHARVELAEPTKTSQHVIGLPMGYVRGHSVAPEWGGCCPSALSLAGPTSGTSGALAGPGAGRRRPSPSGCAWRLLRDVSGSCSYGTGAAGSMPRGFLLNLLGMHPTSAPTSQVNHLFPALGDGSGGS